MKTFFLTENYCFYKKKRSIFSTKKRYLKTVISFKPSIITGFFIFPKRIIFFNFNHFKIIFLHLRKSSNHPAFIQNSKCTPVFKTSEFHKKWLKINLIPDKNKFKNPQVKNCKNWILIPMKEGRYIEFTY